MNMLKAMAATIDHKTTMPPNAPTLPATLLCPQTKTIASPYPGCSSVYMVPNDRQSVPNDLITQFPEPMRWQQRMLL
jgi:hypothetical protein